MIYVRRDPSGKIVAASRDSSSSEAEGWEKAAENDPELVAFCRNLSSRAHVLSASDLELIRVLEDLINLLIENGVIRFTDFPAAAQAKLLTRRDTRAALNAKRLRLLGDGGSETI